MREYKVELPEVGKNYTMVDKMKANGCSKFQPNTTVEDDIAYEVRDITVTSVEQRNGFLYIGFEPAPYEIPTFGFGYTRVYLDKSNQWGTVGLELVKGGN